MQGTIWNPIIETAPLEEIRQLEAPLISRQVARVADVSTYYRNKFEQSDIDPLSIDGYDALATLPFTEKSDIVSAQANGELLGGHQCVPFSDIVRIVGTGGSSGTPTRLGWTAKDIGSYNEMGARALWAMGCRPDDLVINCFNYSLYAGGVMDHGAFETLGAGILPYSVGQSERLLTLLSNLPGENQSYALYSTPSYAIRLAELARKLGVDLTALNVGKGFFSGEPGIQVDDYRKRIEQAWDMTAMDLYGAAEVGVQSGECEYRNGLHYCGAGHVAVELIDSDSGAVKEFADGETGELVFTTLIREACPLIRLRTHDTVQVFTDPCECGRTSFRFNVLGRNDDMFIVKGVNVFPLSVQEALFTLQPDVTGEFRIELDRAPPIDYSPRVCVEVCDDIPASKYGQLTENLVTAIQMRSGFTPSIKLVSQGAIPSEHKTKRLYRIYNGEIAPQLH